MSMISKSRRLFIIISFTSLCDADQLWILWKFHWMAIYLGSDFLYHLMHTEGKQQDADPLIFLSAMPTYQAYLDLIAVACPSFFELPFINGRYHLYAAEAAAKLDLRNPALVAIGLTENIVRNSQNYFIVMRQYFNMALERAADFRSRAGAPELESLLASIRTKYAETFLSESRLLCKAPDAVLKKITTPGFPDASAQAQKSIDLFRGLFATSVFCTEEDALSALLSYGDSLSLKGDRDSSKEALDVFTSLKSCMGGRPWLLRRIERLQASYSHDFSLRFVDLRN